MPIRAAAQVSVFPREDADKTESLRQYTRRSRAAAKLSYASTPR
ncbi:hypothetical protein [Thermaurantimonas aggregans]|nr:hypothetical protein [Thermaurantimonas aggregans]MCX8148814.1 hypothetical protein [Thermaurantimonas aggregans]